MTRRSIICLIVVTWISIPLLCTSAFAEPCVDLGTHKDTDSHKEVRINDDTPLLPFDLISKSEFRAAVNLGASTWNEHGSGGYFTLIGTTSRTNLVSHYQDKSLSECHAAGINYNAVRIVDDTKSQLATAFPICDGHYFEIQVYTKDLAGIPKPWKVGEIVTVHDRDLVGLLTHEFGHTLNIGHPVEADGEVHATMRFEIESGSNRQRDLYQWDYECLDETAGKRNLVGMRQAHDSSGNFGTPQSSSLDNASKGYQAVTWNGLFFTAHYVYMTDTCGVYFKPPAGSGTCIDSEMRLGVSPMATIFNEDSSKHTRIFYPDYKDEFEYEDFSAHKVYRRMSDDSFATASTLTYCNNPIGWYSACTELGNVKTGKRLSATYNTDIERTHLAWVYQNRNTDAESREILISTGYLSSGMLAKPY